MDTIGQFDYFNSTKHNPKASEDDMKKHLEKFGYPINAQILFNQINFSQATGLIMKGN